MDGHVPKKTFNQTLMKKKRIWTFLVFKNVQNIFLQEKFWEVRVLGDPEKTFVTEVGWIFVSLSNKNTLLRKFRVGFRAKRSWTF
jgi:hypothetical protein